PGVAKQILSEFVLLFEVGGNAWLLIGHRRPPSNRPCPHRGLKKGRVMSCNQLHDRWALPFPRTGGVLQTPTGRLAYGRRRHNQQLLTLGGDDALYAELRTSSSAAMATVKLRRLGGGPKRLYIAQPADHWVPTGAVLVHNPLSH